MNSAAMGLDQYQILGVVGEGVSATVYKALDTASQSLVALKVLSPHLQTDAITLERFKREIQITRLLNHPQIVSIYDLIRDGNETCLVMEYLEGQNLKDYIAAHQPLPVETIVSILRQALDVLSVCHAKNVIHRDLKPQNIIVGDGAAIRLVDFGIAKMTTASDLTQTGTSIGSPEYMAPELFAANTFDPRTDIYALGIIAFEMLAGTPPFRGDSLAVLYNEHLSAPLPSLQERRADVPEWLQHVIVRMTAKKAFERYQSADEVVNDLRQRRVLAREIPVLKKHECLQCGEQTLAELPVCLQCGDNAFDALKRGDYDVIYNRDEDDAKLAAFLEAVFGESGMVHRNGRTLLIAGLDDFGAELIQRSAHQHQVLLTVQPHSPTTEFRKAGTLALLSFVVSWIGAFVGARYAYYGSAILQAAHGLSLLDVPIVTFWFAALWIGLTRLQRNEVEPLIPLRHVLRRNLARDYGWLQRLVPSLRLERSAAVKASIAELAEKYFKLVRFARSIDAATTQSMETLLENSARLGIVVSEIETVLQAPTFANRVQSYRFLESQITAEEDPAQRAALEERRQPLHEEVSAYFALEEKHGALTNKLVALQSLFNRLLGRLLVYQVAIDRESQQLLVTSMRTLKEDVALSREIEAELARLS